MKRRGFYQKLFVLAGLYNVGWGIYSAVDPQWLFRFANMPLSNTPEIFACLAMVVGLYGLVYWEVARVPERGFVLAGVGLIGKVLGPLGLIALQVQGVWPPATWILCLTNDLIWWVPFGWYLVDVWPHFRDDLRRPSQFGAQVGSIRHGGRLVSRHR